MKREVRKIVWDVDNTLWDWVSYASKTYPAMCDLLTEEVGIKRERVATAMQTYYTQAQTMESSWLVQGLANQGLPVIDRKALIAKLQKRFHSTRNKSLSLYEGITEVLEVADDKDVDNQILSDAPAFHAASRIRHLNVEQSLFQSMHALQDSAVIPIPQHYKDKDKEHYGLTFPVHTLKREKPHTNLEEVVGMTREEIARHVVVIGDNFKKDMALAARYGCLGIHAKWGEPTPEQIATLSQFSPQAVMQKNMSLGGEVSPTARIIRASEPRDILRILGWQ